MSHFHHFRTPPSPPLSLSYRLGKKQQLVKNQEADWRASLLIWTDRMQGGHEMKSNWNGLVPSQYSGILSRQSRHYDMSTAYQNFTALRYHLNFTMVVS